MILTVSILHTVCKDATNRVVTGCIGGDQLEHDDMLLARQVNALMQDFVDRIFSIVLYKEY